MPKKKLAKVVLDLGYIVYKNDEDMVQHAIECIYEDICNAVKYNEHPIVEIIIRISEFYENGINYGKFEFMDNGIGIEDQIKTTIFKEGYKKEKGEKGLGFGLSLVKKIITGYKGKIWVEDKIEGDHSKGSNFILLIPKY